VRFTSGADSIGVSISAHEHVCSIIYWIFYFAGKSWRSGHLHNQA